MQPLAESHSPHPPTQELMDVLRAKGWMLVGTEGPTGVLRSPDDRHEITVSIGPSPSDWFVGVTLDNAPMPILWVANFVRNH